MLTYVEKTFTDPDWGKGSTNVDRAARHFDPAGIANSYFGCKFPRLRHLFNNQVITIGELSDIQGYRTECYANERPGVYSILVIPNGGTRSCSGVACKYPTHLTYQYSGMSMKSTGSRIEDWTTRVSGGSEKGCSRLLSAASSGKLVGFFVTALPKFVVNPLNQEKFRLLLQF